MSISEKEFVNLESQIRGVGSIIMCFGILVNSAFIYTLWKRKFLHRSLFIFMMAFAISDAAACVSILILRTDALTLTSCKWMLFFYNIPWHLKSFLVMIVFIVITTKPDINRKSSVTTIVVLLLISFSFAVLQGLDGELIAYGPEDIVCVGSDEHYKIVTFTTLLLRVVLPVALLLGFYLINSTENRWKHMIQKSKMQQMMLIMLMIYLCVFTPFSISIQYHDLLRELLFGSDRHLETLLVIYAFQSIAYISMIYKPFLFFFMNDEFKMAIFAMIRHDNSDSVTFENKLSDEDVCNVDMTRHDV